MPTVRSKRKKHNFTLIDNTGLIDKELSWKATGLLAFLMTKPDEWEINLENLTGSKKDGRDATASALNELKKAGYIYHKRYREQGQLKSEYLVFETKEDLQEWLEEQPPETRQDFNHNGKADVVDDSILDNHNGFTTVAEPQWFNHSGLTTVENPIQVINKEVITELEITDQVITEKSLSLNPLSNLSPEERERVLEFGRKKAASLPDPPQLPEAWIVKHSKEILKQYLTSPEGKKAKQDAISAQFDFEDLPLPQRYDMMKGYMNGGTLKWIQVDETKREWRSAFVKYAKANKWFDEEFLNWFDQERAAS